MEWINWSFFQPCGDTRDLSMSNQRIVQLKSKSKYIAVNAYLVAKKLAGPFIR
jgi:hypothetical protein